MFLVYVCKDTTLLRYYQIFSQKCYQKVLVLTFIYINKVVFYRFSQYISNILVLFRYYFIFCAFIIYILYTLLYIGKINGVPPSVGGSCCWWVIGSGGGRCAYPSVAYIQPIPGRRAGASPLRAAGVVRLRSGFRDFFKVSITLSINYLRSPLGRYKSNCFLSNQLITNIL